MFVLSVRGCYASSYTYVIAFPLIRTNMLCAWWRGEGRELPCKVPYLSWSWSWESFWRCVCMHAFLEAHVLSVWALRMHNSVFCSAGHASVLLCSGCTWPWLHWEACLSCPLFSSASKSGSKDKRITLTRYDTNTHWHPQPFMKNDFLKIQVVTRCHCGGHWSGQLFKYSLCSSKHIVLNLDPVTFPCYQRLFTAPFTHPVPPRVASPLVYFSASQSRPCMDNMRSRQKVD